MMLHVMIPNSFALRVSRCFLYFLCLFPLYSLRKNYSGNVPFHPFMDQPALTLFRLGAPEISCSCSGASSPWPSINGYGPATRKNPSPARNIWSPFLFSCFSAGSPCSAPGSSILPATSRPAVEHRRASAAALYSFVHVSSFMPQRLTSTEAAFSGQGMTS